MTISLISCKQAPIQDDLIYELEPYAFSDLEKKKIKESHCMEKVTVEKLVHNKSVIDRELGL